MNRPAENSKSHAHRKHLLTTVNILLLCLGSAGGPIISRIYYLHGGHHQWLSAFLETAGFPVLLVPLSLSPKASFPPLRFLLSASLIGVLTGLDDFLYAYGLNFLPVSTSAVLIATQLAFTAILAFFIVRQRFTPFSINAVVLLTAGAAVLALHSSGDRPPGVTPTGYWKGFGLTLAAAALYGLVLPLMELTHASAGKLPASPEADYTLVIQMQIIIGFFATLFCAVGMIVNRDFQAIPREAAEFGLGKGKYYVVIVGISLLWQCFFVGAVGVISCVNTLTASVIIAVFIPVIEVLAFIFLHENFSGEKGAALFISLWGLASYSYGEYRQRKKMNKELLQPLPR